jgi:hypothetical protein
MLILVRDQQGREKAIDIGSTGWTAEPDATNEMRVNVMFDDGFRAVLTIDQYERIKSTLLRNGELLDTSAPETPQIR